MSAISSKLRKWVDPATGREGLTYWCQGCESAHSICTKGTGAWGWNDDVERPVFTPSVLSTQGHYVSNWKPENGCACDYAREHPEEPPGGFRCVRCHTFVGCNGAKPGEVIFLGDCTHALASTVQPFPDLPLWLRS